MTKLSVAAAALTALLSASAGCVSAFAPSPLAFGVRTAHSPHSASSALSMSDAAAASASSELLVDGDFEGVNLVRLMGLNRLKKIRRRHRRELNARIAAFEAVQDGEGEWVEATAEQTAALKAQAKAADSTNHRPFKRPSKKATALRSAADESAAAADGPASSTEPLRLIIAGAPASGKGTQCEVLKSKYGVVHLSTGDMLRAAVRDGTEVGKAAKSYMDEGKLVPDEVIIGVVKDRLAQPDCAANGWLLDGFPRTPAQAKALSDAGVSADCFLFLNVPDEILVERVVGRRTDPDTGKIYHMTFSPPDDDDVRDRLVQRSDDTEEKVVVRLEQFHANVDAVRGSYEDIGAEVDGNQSPEEVTKAIDAAIAARVKA